MRVFQLTIAIALIMSCCCKVKALDIPLPQDVATLEATIDLHKWMIEEVNKRIQLVGELEVEQVQVTQSTTKWEKVMDRLHDRQRGVMNWLLFLQNLNKMRLNFQRIYDEEKTMLDTMLVWMSKTPDVSSFGQIKKSYDVLKIQVAIGLLAYTTQANFIQNTKMLTKLFLIQFGENALSNTFSEAMRNLTMNMATDEQRINFTWNILSLQNRMIADLSSCNSEMRMIIHHYVKIDLIETSLNFLESRKFHEKLMKKVISTW